MSLISRRRLGALTALAGLGVVAAVATILVVKDYRVLRRFPYVLFLSGLVLLPGDAPDRLLVAITSSRDTDAVATDVRFDVTR